MDFKEYITPSDLMILTPDQQDRLWRWANRTKINRPSGLGLSGMPLLSIGRCIEFIIDQGIPLKDLMAALVIDFSDGKNLVDILWGAIVVMMNKPVKVDFQVGTYKWIKPSDLITKGTMIQWIDQSKWKQLSLLEMSKLWKWANGNPKDLKFFMITERPMLSIGRLIEFLLDNKMSLKEVFHDCVKYDNKEWNKLQLIDVLWEKVKLVLKITLMNKKSFGII